MEIEGLTLDEWGDVLPADGFEVFHTPEALSVLDDHTSGELTLLAGYKGQTPVALLPVFVRSGPVGKAVFSPPPQMGVPRLGPLVMPTSPKQRKHETVTRRFVDGVLDELNATGPLSIVRLRCGLGFSDPRPFTWNDFRVEPAFTYVVDADAPDMETVLEPFNSSLRRELRRASESDLTVSLEGVDGARLVIEQVLDRFDEQDRSPTLQWPFVRDLIEALGDRVRAYVVRDPSGAYRSGIVALVSNDAVYYWQGGVRESYEETREDDTTRSISANAKAHWAILEDILTDPALENVTGYDLVGANTPRLCEYKSQFGGRLRPYYVVESTGPATRLAKSGYQLLGRTK